MFKRRSSIDFGHLIEKNFWLYVVTVLCLCTGIVLGIYATSYMKTVDKTELTSYLNSFLTNIKAGDVKHLIIAKEAIINNLIFIAAIWFLGLTIVGIPVSLIVNVIKGFTLGFTMNFFLQTIGTKGLGLSLLLVLPQNLIYIPCIIIASVISMEFSLNLLRENIYKKWTSNLGIKITQYTLSMTALFAIMLVGVLFEAYLSPIIVRYLIPSL